MTGDLATAGVVLAGGLSSRMGGGDKPLRVLAGRTILSHVVERLRPQCAAVALNVNGDPRRFGATDLPVIADSLPERAGPLGGILAALDWAASAHPGIAWLVTAAGDTPFIPSDLVARLHEERARAGASLACARSGGRIHPVIALWPVASVEKLRRAILAGERRVGRWLEEQGAVSVGWDGAPADPFFNINTPADLQEAERLIRAGTIFA